MTSRQLITTPSGQSQDLTVSPLLMVQTDRLDLGGTIAFFRRRLGLIIAIIGLAVLTGAAITWSRPTLYTARSVVSIEIPEKEEVEGTTANNSALMPTDGFIDTQVQIVQSEQLARQVALALGWLEGASEAEQSRIVRELQSKVSAFRRGSSYTLEIVFKDTDPQVAARVANEYARQFGKWEQRSERDRKKKSIKQLAERLTDLRAQAHTDTERLQRYRIATNMLSTSGASLTEQEISSYNQAVTQARADAAQDQARLRTALGQLRSGSTGDDVGEALDSPVISSLRNRQAQVAGEVANLQARYGINHPQLVRAKGELEEIERQIEAEIARIISNLQAKQQVSQQRLESLKGSLAAAREKLSQNNKAMVGLTELERQAQTSQELYEAYLNAYKKLLADENLERPNARVLSMAAVPLLPSSPNIPMNLVLSAVIGIGAALMLAIVAESLFTGVTSSEEVEQKLGINLLGTIPLLSSVSKLREAVPAISAEPQSAFAESFRALRTSIEQAVHGPAQVIAVTSALPKEGKTTIAACLAQTMAMSGASTLLIDCDPRRPGTSRLLQLSGDYLGLVQVLDGSTDLSDALVPGAANLWVLPARPASAEEEALLIGGQFEHLIQDLRSKFDCIILDLPPVLSLSSTRVMASHADATVLALGWRKTAAAAVRAAIAQLPNDRVNVVGIAMNGVNMRSAHRLGTYAASSYYGEKAAYA